MLDYRGLGGGNYRHHSGDEEHRNCGKSVDERLYSQRDRQRLAVYEFKEAVGCAQHPAQPHTRKGSYQRRSHAEYQGLEGIYRHDLQSACASALEHGDLVFLLLHIELRYHEQINEYHHDNGNLHQPQYEPQSVGTVAVIAENLRHGHTELDLCLAVGLGLLVADLQQTRDIVHIQLTVIQSIALSKGGYVDVPGAHRVVIQRVVIGKHYIQVFGVDALRPIAVAA